MCTHIVLATKLFTKIYERPKIVWRSNSWGKYKYNSYTPYVCTNFSGYAKCMYVNKVKLKGEKYREKWVHLQLNRPE